MRKTGVFEKKDLEFSLFHRSIDFYNRFGNPPKTAEFLGSAVSV
jgi:hypothetical protein